MKEKKKNNMIRATELAASSLGDIEREIRQKSLLGRLIFTGNAYVFGEDEEVSDIGELALSGKIAPEIRPFVSRIADNRFIPRIVGFLADKLMNTPQDAEDIKTSFRTWIEANRKTREKKILVTKTGLWHFPPKL